METIDLKPAKKANKVSSSAKTEGKPSKKEKAQLTDKKTAEVIKEKVAKEKDLMYIYPNDVTDGSSKKKFRAAARRQKNAFWRDIKNEKDADKKAKLIKKANKWSHATYTAEHQVAFE